MDEIQEQRDNERDSRASSQEATPSAVQLIEILESMSDALYTVNENWCITYINRKTEEIWGQRREDLLGRNVWALFPFAIGTPSHQLYLQAMQERRAVTFEYFAPGVKRWLNARVYPNGAGLIVHLSDITAHKAAEAAEREQRRFAEAQRDSLAALTGSLDVDSVMQQILASAAIVVPSEAGSIILFEGNSGHVAYLRGFTPEAEVFFKEHRFSTMSRGGGNVISDKQPYFVPDTQADPTWVALPVSHWIRSSIGMPIEIRGAVIGLLVVDSAIPNHFQATDIEKLQIFANYAGLALENAQHVTQLEQKVVTRTAELHDAKEQVEAILDNSPDGILLLLPDLRIRQANAAFYRLLACDPDDDCYESLYDVMHEDDMQRVKAVIAPMLREQAAQQIEMRCCRKNGTLFDAELSLTAITTAVTGTARFFCTLRDITERKRVAETLREQHDFLQLVINSVPDLIMVKDRESRFHLANERAAHLYGITPAAMIGKTDADLNPNPDEVAFFRQKDLEVLNSGQPVFIPEQTILGRYYQTDKTPLKNLAGQFDRLLVVSFDITKHKQAETALQQALEHEKELGELKSRFVSMASHEFRTPLASILALTETLHAYRHKLKDAQIAERLESIKEQVNYLKAIMDDVLQLARIQANQFDLNLVRFDLTAFCLSVIDEFQSQPAIKHHLSFYETSAACEVELDTRLLRQIISNLVSNAIKYSPEDKPILVSLQVTGSTFVLQVIDQGIGIPAADLKHLFQPFHRATNVGTIAGTGLGLAITKEAVERHGGTITVESQVDIGTTFTVSIPLATSGENDDKNLVDRR